MVAFYTPKPPHPQHVRGFFYARKHIGDTAMSLRDELEPVRTGFKSRIKEWLDSQPETFRTEFIELVHDHTIGHTQLLELAKKYGCNIQVGRFTEWRKQTWASKTN